MFFYIHFLRPPPVQATTTHPVSFSIQLANDLRTELRQQPTDIYYSWSSPAAHSRPAKLLTWTPTCAYKTLRLVPPLSSTPSVAWTLHLQAVSPNPSPQAPDISQIDMTTALYHPFPVSSLPIQIMPLSQGGSEKKQDSIERAISMVCSDGEKRCITLREKTSYDLDKKIWDSGVGLSAWMSRMIAARVAPSGSTILRELYRVLTSKRLVALELGSGTGIAALSLACVLHADVFSSDPRPSIWATDLPSAVPLIEHNFAANASLCQGVELTVAALDWDKPELPEGLCPRESEEGQRFVDLILMADVTYNIDAFPSLLATIKQILTVGSNRSTFVLLGYKERDVTERELWREFDEQLGIKFEHVGSVPGAGGAPVEIWVAKRSAASLDRTGVAV